MHGRRGRAGPGPGPGRAGGGGRPRREEWPGDRERRASPHPDRARVKLFVGGRLEAFRLKKVKHDREMLSVPVGHL